VRLLSLLVLAVLLAACGSGAEQTEETGVPASSGQSESYAEGSGTASTSEPESAPADEPGLKPPPVVLVYKGEEQQGVRGSYCVSSVDPETGQGEGICVDGSAPHPKDVTAVAPGDRVTFVLSHATVKKDASVVVRPLGCTDEEVEMLHFEPGTGELDWTVDLEPGAYQLDVFARFEADDGRTGDVGAALGLTVAGAKEYDALGVQAVTRSMQVCPFAD
jgi:hypothetical protein